MAYAPTNKASFGSIQNNIALKQQRHDRDIRRSFGSIQNNIALKPIHRRHQAPQKFW